MNRIIMHVDFDYFYAQVEEHKHQGGKNKPLVVCMFSGRTETSGAVATCNYVARKYGVKSGMPIAFAKRKLAGTDALFLPADHMLYTKVSADIMHTLAEFADAFEPASIDEAFLDISKMTNGDYKKAQDIAREIKKKIYETCHLTCSIGIGPNKLVAKIASDFEKPNGLTIIKFEDIRKFLDDLDVDKIPGIGNKTKELLAIIGINKIADLRNVDTALLVEKFGKNTGASLVLAARGEDDEPVGIIQEQKQISRISTLKNNSRTFHEFAGDVDYLINDVFSELKKQNLLCGAVGIIVIDENMETLTRSHTLQHPTDSINEIKKIVYDLYQNLIEQTAKVQIANKVREFRRVGVKVEKLQSNEGQKTLWEF